MAVGDTAKITYTRTKSYIRTVHERDEDEVDETKDEVETRVVKHQRSSFPDWELDAAGELVRDAEGDPINTGDKPQTDREWHANMRREIGADLSELNRVDEAKVDITQRIVSESI